MASLKPGQPVLLGGHAQHPADHRHLALAADGARDVLAGHAPAQLVIDADKAQLVRPGHVRVHDHHRNPRGLGLVEHRQDLRHSRRSHRQRRHPLEDLVFQDGHLLVDVDLALRAPARPAARPGRARAASSAPPFMRCQNSLSSALVTSTISRRSCPPGREQPPANSAAATNTAPNPLRMRLSE